MRILSATLIFALLSSVFACQKEALTKPVSFKGTEYVNLSLIDENGKPGNLLKDEVSPEFISFGRDTLPERKDWRNDPNLFNSNTGSDISITKKADVFVTFLFSGTGYKNTISFYSYPTATPPSSPKEIKKITHFFPNAGWQTPLVAGDKVKLGTFDPGTSIGFVLLQNGWNPDTKKINNEAVHFCYNDALNPEVDPKLKKHVLLINNAAQKKVLVGFEDVDRTSMDCDHDFNDVVMYVTIKEL